MHTELSMDRAGSSCWPEAMFRMQSRAFFTDTCCNRDTCFAVVPWKLGIHQQNASAVCHQASPIKIKCQTFFHFLPTATALWYLWLLIQVVDALKTCVVGAAAAATVVMPATFSLPSQVLRSFRCASMFPSCLNFLVVLSLHWFK